MKKSIIFSAVVVALLVGCGDKGGESTSVSDAVKSVVEKTTEVAKDTTDVAVDSAKEATKVAVEKTVEATKAVVADTVEKATQKVVKVKEAVVAKATEAVATTGVDASALYKACGGCHGAAGEKKALGKSQVISGWDTAKTEAALNGYKDGSYGGAMKGVMAGQVAKLSADDIKALASHIATLK